MNAKKSSILILITIIFFSFWYFEFNQYFSFQYIKEQQAVITSYVHEYVLWAAIIYLSVYILIAAVSLPGAAIMTLLAGAIFGLFWGTILASFGSSIGALLAFLVVRYLIKDFEFNKFKRQIDIVNKGIEKEGSFYLFAIRLVPIFPFFIVNIVMAFTKIKVFTFYWVSQIGMLFVTIIFVNAGTRLAELDSIGGILSPKIIFSFIILGIFPILAKKLLNFIKKEKVLVKFKKPKYYDANVIVLGAGAAGLVASYIAATVKAKVILIEKNKMGGDCLNTGCVPSKALIKSASIMNYFSTAELYGIKKVSGKIDFAAVMQRVQRIIKTIEPHDSIARYQDLGVDCIIGEAKIISPYEVVVNGQNITCKNIILATGARPLLPPIPGLQRINYYTSDTIWELKKLPKRLVIIGGGPIGCELAQAFARLGSEVSIIEMADRILAKEDQEVAQLIANKFIKEGIKLYTNHTLVSCDNKMVDDILYCEHNGKRIEFTCDAVLIALGRKANVEKFGLEELEISLADNKTIAVNEYLQTNYPNIYACGDVVGPYQFTHAAAHQAWHASVNSLLGMFKKFKINYTYMPWVTYTSPEVAQVGLNEQAAIAENIEYDVVKYDLKELDRAIVEDATLGFIKVLTKKGKDKIIGVTIVADRAGEMISQFILAMKYGIGLNKILSTVLPYPTWTEANKLVAGEWRKTRVSKKIMRLLHNFHMSRIKD